MVDPQMFTNDGGPEPPQLRQPLGHEAVDADALQADGVQHAGRRLDDARRGMTVSLGEEQALDRHAAERREVDGLGVFDAVAEAAGRRNERVLEVQGPEVNGQVAHQCPAESPSHTMADPSNTGPSRHERTNRSRPSARTRTTQL